MDSPHNTNQTLHDDSESDVKDTDPRDEYETEHIHPALIHKSSHPALPHMSDVVRQQFLGTWAGPIGPIASGNLRVAAGNCGGKL